MVHHSPVVLCTHDLFSKYHSSKAHNSPWHYLSHCFESLRHICWCGFVQPTIFDVLVRVCPLTRPPSIVVHLWFLHQTSPPTHIIGNRYLNVGSQKRGGGGSTANKKYLDLHRTGTITGLTSISKTNQPRTDSNTSYSHTFYSPPSHRKT